MIVRKNMGRASPFLVVFLGFGFFFVTYNLLTLVMQKAGSSFTEEVAYDPVVRRPHELSDETGAKFHVALTATDAPYSKWQCRIMYYWYKKIRNVPGSDMGGFTRLLHSGNPDNLMDEIPTVVVDPLPEGLDRSILEKIAPTWMNLSLRMKDDQETDKAFGWVLEMYGYAIASALHGVRHNLPPMGFGSWKQDHHSLHIRM